MIYYNSFPFYAYMVREGEVAKYLQNRIYFRADGVVDWIEVVVGDADSSYHLISETAAHFGNILDTIYINSNYSPKTAPGTVQMDEILGFDQFYVWSECGLALDAVPVKAAPDTIKLTTRDPNPQDGYGTIGLLPNKNSIVLIRVLFNPTTYKGFEDYYQYIIARMEWDGVHGPWGAYIARIYASSDK